MGKRVTYTIALVVIGILTSCSSTKRVATTPTSSNYTEQSYIEAYKDLAISEMKRTGVPASITLAQGIIESDYGRSTLAREANNHFGIKCHGNWSGATITHDDDRRNECFRKYKHAEDSYRDHSDFLVNGQRYASLFDLSPTDYKGWAKGLKKAGYATNPDYANMLIRKIEESGLHQYDLERGRSNNRAADVPVAVAAPPVVAVPDVQEVEIPTTTTVEGVASPSAAEVGMVIHEKTPRLMVTNRIQYIVVKDGETFQSIEEEFDLLRWEIQKYNELDKDSEIRAGQIIYLQPKRNKADVGNETHVVREGETMYSISQLYGVWVKKLYEYNRMNANEEPSVGDTLWLRSLMPVR